MSKRKTAMRAASVAMVVAGAGMYFLQSGLIPGVGNAQPAPQAPIVPDNIAAAPEAPVLPAVVETADVALPEQAPQPLPVSLDDPSVDEGAAPSGLLASIEAIRTVEEDAEEVALLEATDPLPDDDKANEDLAAASPPVVLPDAEDTETPEVALSPFGLPCDLNVSTTAMPGAMVALDVLAPCQPDARIVIEHSGLTITAQTDALGLLTMDIPAFESPAFFTVRFPDAQSESSLVSLPDLANYDRVAVQWSDDRQLALHAIPFGTAFGAPGHIWEENPGDIAAAQDGTGGALLEIGDLTVSDPMVAQIFTFPHASLSDGEVIEISIDAPVTETTCGQPVSARTLEMTRAGVVEVTPVTLTVPGCDAVGDYLVLQNLFQDLTVAAN